jgi:hypothetical protein
VTAEQRQAVMQLDDFDRVCAMADYAIAQADGKMKVTVKGIIGGDLLKGPEAKAFEARWGAHHFLHLEGNWADETYHLRGPVTTPCHRPNSQIMVLWDGRVSLCCFDGEGKEILGDLNTQTIRDVFAGPRATEIRLAHCEGRRNDVAICAGCSGI